MSSSEPTYEHRYNGADHIVSYSLLKSFSELGHTVDYALIKYDFDSPNPNMHSDDLKELERLKVNYLGDFSSYVSKKPPFFNLLGVIFPSLYRYVKNIKSINGLDQKIKDNSYDMVILFWDTFFENYQALENNEHVIGYFARPRFESAITRVKDRVEKNVVDKIKNFILLRFYKYQIDDHFKRMSTIAKASNLCLIDADAYLKKGVNCKYISNTWTDNFGKDSFNHRIKNFSDDEINIMLSFGNMGATGNTFGMLYFIDDVYPLMEKDGLFNGDIKININIYGGGKLEESLKAKILKKKNIFIRGFVDDIDNEILNNQIILLMNNAGPYTGAYTRPIYVFSSSGLLIAHKNIIKSMPEIKHMENSLLGETPEEIVDCIKLAIKNKNLREKIQFNARKTYEEKFMPIKVASEICDYFNSKNE